MSDNSFAADLNAAETSSQETAADNAINDYRTTYSDALLDTGHVEHERRAKELKMMYERRYAAEPTQFDPVAGQARPENSIDDVAEEEMKPLSYHEFEIGEDTDFGLSVDKETYGWDHQLEAEARQTFATASVNGAQARLAATTYYETLQPAFDPNNAARQTAELLRNQYGPQADRAIAGTNRMLKQLTSPQLYKFIATSGLGNHPRFVGEAVRVARRRGYF